MKILTPIQLIFAIASILLLVACKENPSKSAKNIPTFNIKYTLDPQNESTLSKRVKIESIIPLETSDISLLGEVRKIIKDEELLFILDTNGTLKQFNTNGQFLKRIGKEGQGPGEYSTLTDFSIDHKNKDIYINSLEKLSVYDFKGNFKRKISFKETLSSQVFTFCNDKLFYIAPDKKYPNNIESAPLITVLNLDGEIKKEISTNRLTREERFPMFNNIATDGKFVFYKEEFRQTLYKIHEDYSIDSLCLLDFGEYALQPEDLNTSKSKIWEERIRLQNILPTENYIIFIVQKGLMSPILTPFIWDKRNKSFYQFSYKVIHNEREYKVLPFCISNNKIVGTLTNPDKPLDDENPILVILQIN